MLIESGITDTNYIATGLTNDLTYKFKVKARNIKGLSDYSIEVAILAARVPDAAINLENVPAITTATQIGLQWSPGASNGGSAILDYRLSYDQSVGTWVVLEETIAGTSYTTSVELLADRIYVFKVETRNVVGYSSFSDVVSVRAARKPNAPINLLNDPSITDQY